MEFICEQGQLAKAIARFSSVNYDKSVSSIGLRASDSGVSLAAADKILTVYSDCEGVVTSTGEAFLPPKLFVDIIKELPEGPVRFTSEGKWLKITAGSYSQCEMKLPYVEEQSWPKKPDEACFTQVAPLDAATFSYLVEQVMICVNHESSVRYSTVAFLHSPEPGLLRVVGTDGFRLSYAQTKLDVTNPAITKGVCLSKRCLSEILRVCSEGFKSVLLSISEEGRTLRLQVEGCEVFARVSSVAYPSYQAAIPESQPNRVEVPKSGLQSMVKRVLLTSNRHRTVTLHFAPENLRISSTNAGNSEGKESLALQEANVAQTEVSFKGKYLLDICSVSTNSEKLSVEFLDGTAPIIMRPGQGPDHSESLHVLVPMHEHGARAE